MEVVGNIHGSAPVIKRLMVSADTIAGIPVKSAAVATTNVGQVVAIANSAGNPIVGLTLDAVDSFPASPTGAVQSDANLFITVDVNPTSIYRAKLAGGATADTALTAQATSGASADGSTATGVTTLDDGVIWGYEGANAGFWRRADDTSGSVSVSFPNAIASGDTFLAAQGIQGYVATSQAYFDLTSDFSQIDATTADSDNDNFVIVEMLLRDAGSEGITNSYYDLIAWQHAFSGAAQQG